MGQKRPRSDLEEDCDDCLPISKRINKLHIKPTRLSQDDDLTKQAPCGECSTQACGNEPGDSGWAVDNMQSQQNPMNSQQLSMPVITYSQLDECSTHRLENNNNNISNCRSQLPVQLASESMEDVTVYDPELDESENPYYFHSNHLLFNAHVSRTSRTKSFPQS